MNQDNELSQRSLMLMGTAKILAGTSYTEVSDRFSALKKVDSDHWDFIFTNAAVFVAVSQLNREDIPEKEKDEIRVAITNSLLEVYPDGVSCVENCTEFVDRTYDSLASQTEYSENPQWLFSDSLGGWMVWNLLGHAPESDEEGKLARTLGGLVVHGFVSWWK